MELADDALGVPAYKLRLSTADGKVVYDNEEASVPTVHQTKKEALIVTGTFVCAPRSVFAVAQCCRSSRAGRT